MNFLSCPLGEGWIGASKPEGLGHLVEIAHGAEKDAGPGDYGGYGENGKYARIHSLILGRILWLGARLPVYLAQWEIEQAGRVAMRAVELVFPLDPWALADAEAFCLAVRDAGIGLIVLPVAPVSHAIETIDGGEDCPGWKIPDESTLAERARGLLEMQVTGMAQWGREAEPLTQIRWVDPETSLAKLGRYEERLRWAWAKCAGEKETVI